jgi:hypothetical protein
MAKVIKMVDLAESVIAMAVATYAEIPKVFENVDRKQLAKTLKIAGGNIRRVTLEEDRSLIVHNKPVW